MTRWQMAWVAATYYYAWILRYMRTASRFGKGFELHKCMVGGRLKLFFWHFGVSVCGFAVRDNHLLVICRLGPDVAEGWSVEVVVSVSIATLFPECLVAA